MRSLPNSSIEGFSQRLLDLEGTSSSLLSFKPYTTFFNCSAQLPGFSLRCSCYGRLFPLSSFLTGGRVSKGRDSPIQPVSSMSAFDSIFFFPPSSLQWNAAISEGQLCQLGHRPDQGFHPNQEKKSLRKASFEEFEELAGTRWDERSKEPLLLRDRIIG